MSLYAALNWSCFQGSTDWIHKRRQQEAIGGKMCSLVVVTERERDTHNLCGKWNVAMSTSEVGGFAILECSRIYNYIFTLSEIFRMF